MAGNFEKVQAGDKKNTKKLKRSLPGFGQKWNFGHWEILKFVPPKEKSLCDDDDDDDNDEEDADDDDDDDDAYFAFCVELPDFVVVAPFKN